MSPAARLPLLGAGFLSLVFGVAAGRVRLGWDIPLPSESFAVLHGPLIAGAAFPALLLLATGSAVIRGRRPAPAPQAGGPR